jgi:hypothetical protein
MIVPAIIIITNGAVKFILKKLAIVERPWSLSEQKWDIVKNMSILTITNTGLILLVVHLNFTGSLNTDNWFPFFTGSYDRFSG